VIDNASTLAQFYVGGIRNPDGTMRESPIAVFTLTWTNNVQRDTGYGIHSEAGAGTLALNARTTRYLFTNNKVAGLRYTYPAVTTAIDEAAFQAAKSALLAELGR
jgi:hypothetical protein